ncbi:MAG: hypothetical protein NZ839_01245, partial [Endomicrobia bacterium]|nr:hypothetical protein [Endomicrobiia bacterium]
MKKFLILGSFIVYTSSFAFVPLSNQQTSVSSFRSLATMGMFYDELDIISAHPVSLLEFSGNTLYTTWGNIRGINNTNRIVSYYSPAAVVDNTFVFGLCGDALSNFNIKNSRIGFVFQNLGAKTNYFNLDNITGLDSEGVWKDIISENVDNSADGSIDREQIFESSMKNYANRKMNQFNVGFAKKGLNFGKFRNVIAGVSISRQSDYTHRITEGIKSYKRRYLTDNGLPSGWPSGIRVGDTYELNYADNDILVNSFDITDILAQARISNFFLTGLRLDLGIGLRVRNDYNPTSLIKNADTVAISDDKLNNAGNGVVYDYRFAKRNVSLATGGQLNYDDFTGLQGDFLLTNLWRPAWAGGIDAPGLEDFSDNRGGFGFLLRTEAGYRLFNIPLTGVFNFSITPQKLDRKEVY